MTAKDILEETRPLGRESYKKVLLNHGVKEPCLGVKIEEFQKIRKRIRVDYRLALALYDTGVYDAMYLAGLIADDVSMPREDLQDWVRKANSGALVGSTVPSVISIKNDAELDLAELEALLECVRRTIYQSPNEVRYQMNGFVIATGCYVRELTDIALKCGEQIGPVRVDMGKTSCQVPFAPESIRKFQERGTIGKKRKSAKC